MMDKIKISALFLMILSGVFRPGLSQVPTYCTYNFENNACREVSYITLLFPGDHNIWKICIPAKSTFNTALSMPWAILTGRTGSYPININSSFIIKFVPSEDCLCMPVLGGWYKFDSDSLNDFGQIEISMDRGKTWLDALSDSVIQDWQWITPKPVLTGRICQWQQFLAYLPDFAPGDTLCFRFTFVSDNIETNHQGWMLDDLALTERIEGAEDTGSADQITIFPNPAANRISVTVNNFSGEMNVSIYDMQCKLKLSQTFKKNKEEIDISALEKDSYIIRVLSGESYKASIFVKN